MNRVIYGIKLLALFVIPCVGFLAGGALLAHAVM
jgi:hypothetical protein